MYKKKHAFDDHLPGIFTETLPAGVENIMRTQVKALEQVTSWLMGQLATLEELLQFVVILTIAKSEPALKVST